jgi:hypothetical protein
MHVFDISDVEADFEKVELEEFSEEKHEKLKQLSREEIIQHLETDVVSPGGYNTPGFDRYEVSNFAKRKKNS